MTLALNDFLSYVGDGDEYGAIELVNRLLDDGMSPQQVMIDVVADTQRRVGELWAANEWSIAREHAATAISERAVATVAARTTVRPHRGRITVACVDGEWHALPTRILGEMLRLDGWRVDYLGASVPGPHLVTHLHQTGPDAVALSCMISTRLPRAHAAVTACRAAGIPVIAGGRGFGLGGRYAKTLGADAWATGAPEAVERLAAGLQLAGDPYHAVFLGGDEYTYVVRNRPALLETALRRLGEIYPRFLTYDRKQLDATAEDLGHVADFLAAALYVSDTAVFAEFADWTTAVLAARGVPASAFRLGLDVVAEQLTDYPRALAILDAARSRPAP